jgi:hypothetical protein
MGHARAHGEVNGTSRASSQRTRFREIHGADLQIAALLDTKQERLIEKDSQDRID